MAKLFEKDSTVITRHIAKIYQDREVGDNSCREVITIGATGKHAGRKYKAKKYNIDVILSVGYRVN